MEGKSVEQRRQETRQGIDAAYRMADEMFAKGFSVEQTWDAMRALIPQISDEKYTQLRAGWEMSRNPPEQPGMSAEVSRRVMLDTVQEWRQQNGF